MVKKLLATKEIYTIVVDAIAARRGSGVWRDDALQKLLDAEDEDLVIVGVSRQDFTHAKTPKSLLSTVYNGLADSGSESHRNYR